MRLGDEWVEVINVSTLERKVILKYESGRKRGLSFFEFKVLIRCQSISDFIKDL